MDMLDTGVTICLFAFSNYVHEFKPVLYFLGAGLPPGADHPIESQGRGCNPATSTRSGRRNKRKRYHFYDHNDDFDFDDIF